MQLSKCILSLARTSLEFIFTTHSVSSTHLKPLNEGHKSSLERFRNIHCERKTLFSQGLPHTRAKFCILSFDYVTLQCLIYHMFFLVRFLASLANNCLCELFRLGYIGRQTCVRVLGSNFLAGQGM